MKPSFSRRQVLLSGLGSAALAAAPHATAQSEDIRIGMSAPLAGPQSIISSRYRAGALLCFEKAHAQGGVGGRKIQLLSLDDAGEPERCAANAHQLIQSDGVVALFGVYGTATTQAALPVLHKAAVALVAPFTGAQALRNPFTPYLWHTRASYHEETEFLIKQLTHVGIQKVAVVYQADAFGSDGLEGVRQALARRNLTLAAAAALPRNSLDVMPAVETLAAANPSGIVIVLPHGPATAFVSTWRRQSLTHQTTALRALSVVDANLLRAALTESGTGVGLSQVVPFPYDARRTPVAAEYVAATQASGQGISFAGLEGFIAAKTLISSLRKVSGKPDRDKLIDAMKNVGNLDLGGFSLQFSGRQNAGSRFVELIALNDRQGFVR